MADNSNRWQRITGNPGDKPSFAARQSTDALRRPSRDRDRKSRRRTHGRSTRTWWIVGVLLLCILTGLLAWQVFFT